MKMQTHNKQRWVRQLACVERDVMSFSDAEVAAVPRQKSQTRNEKWLITDTSKDLIHLCTPKQSENRHVSPDVSLIT